MTFKLIYRTFDKPKRGANLSSNYLSKIDKRIIPVDIDLVESIESLREEDCKLVFVSQSPNLYYKKVNFLKVKDDIFYIRHEHSPILFKNPVNNGFSYTKQKNKKNNFINKIKYFSPFLYNFKINKKNTEKKIIGYYLRPTLTPDSSNYFLDFINNLSEPIDLVTMGIYVNYLNHPNIKTHKHTYDNIEFFESISHYIYFKSIMFIDPFPNSLLEAVQTNKQIIVPDNKRDFNDGIDDILSCINYHTTLNDEIIDNSNSVLNIDFKKYVKRLVDKEFKYTKRNDLNNYKDFKEWIIENV